MGRIHRTLYGGPKDITASPASSTLLHLTRSTLNASWPGLCLCALACDMGTVASEILVLKTMGNSFGVSSLFPGPGLRKKLLLRGGNGTSRHQGRGRSPRGGRGMYRLAVILWRPGPRIGQANSNRPACKTIA